MSNIVIYESEGTGVSIEVKLDSETLWLSLNQISALFGRDKSVISRHLSNVFKEGELDKDSAVAFFATVQFEGNREVERQVEYFNLDAILSVGYRVNSKQGTAFRKWTSKVLQSHVLNGYSINEYNLTARKIKELEGAVELLSRTLISNSLVNDIGIEVLEIISEYAKTWSVLLEYDEGRLRESLLKQDVFSSVNVVYDDIIAKIVLLKKELMEKGEASHLFAVERDNAFRAILGSISQTFDGVPLYKDNLEMAANLLYFIIKDHPFCDGNKRVGCFVFLLFLSSAGIPLSIISNNSLIALALWVAESDRGQKDIMIKLIIRMLSNK